MTCCRCALHAKVALHRSPLAQRHWDISAGEGGGLNAGLGRNGVDSKFRCGYLCKDTVLFITVEVNSNSYWKHKETTDVRFTLHK